MTWTSRLSKILWRVKLPNSKSKTDITGLQKFLTVQPDRGRILRQDKRDTLDDEELRRSTAILQRNADIKAKRNIKDKP